MLRKWSTIVLLLLATPVLALAQNTGKLAGRVLDASTGEPLPGANVVIEGTQLGTASDVEGNYFIIGVPVGTYDIQASFVGYSPQTVTGVAINSGYTRELDFSLQPGAELDEIVVEYERPLIQRDAIGAPRVVGAEELDNLPIRGVANVAALQSGVVSREGTSDLFIRGGRDQEVTFYVDGIKVTESAVANGLIGVNQDAIAEQEMLIGTIPARYGDAQSGVISITTKSGGDRFFGSVEGMTSQVLDSYGYNLGSLSLGGPIVPGRASFFGSGQYIYQADANVYGIPTYRLSDAAFDELLANPQVLAITNDAGDRQYIPFPWDAARAAFEAGNPIAVNDTTFRNSLNIPEGYRLESGNLINAPDTYTADRFERKKGKDRPLQNLILNGNLSFNVTDNIMLRVGGGYETRAEEQRGYANQLYNRDIFYHDERDTWRVFGTLQQRFSNNVFYQLRVGYQDYHWVNYPNGFSDQVQDAINYGDIEGSGIYADIGRRYFTVQNGEYRPRFTTDGTISPGQAAGISFVLPGSTSSRFRKEHEQQLQISGNATTQLGLHQIEFGGEFQQMTERLYDLNTGLGLSRYIDDGNCEQTPCVARYEDLPFDAFRPRVTYYGYDFRGLNEVDDQDIQGYYDRTNLNIAPYKPIYYAGYIQDKIEYRDLIINLGLRVDVFDNNTTVLKDLYSPLPIVRAGALGNAPSGIGSDYAVYFNDAGNVVGYRDLEGNFFDTDGSRIDANIVVNNRAGAPQQTNEPLTSAYEDYEPQVTFMPRVGVSFPVTDQALFFASYNVTSQRPTEFRFAPFSVYEEITTQNSRTANPSLHPERTTQYELGFRQRLGATAALTISGFYRTQKNKISNRNLIGGFPSFGTYLNVDFTTTKGVEFGFDLRRTRNLALTANYTLAFAEGTGSDATATAVIVWRGNQFPNTIAPADFDQRHTLNATLDYRFGEGEGPMIFGAPLLENFGVNLLAQYGSGQAYTALVGSAFSINDSFTANSVGSINSSRLPSTYRLDLRLDRRFNLGGSSLRAYLTVLNLLDTRNIVAVYRATGLPDQDGYLLTPQGQAFLESQPDVEAARFNYMSYVGGPVNNGGSHSSAAPFFYSQPRQVRLGFQLDF